MAEIEHDIVDLEGRKVGTASLDGRVFGAEIHEQSVHMVVRQQRSGRRSGTHATLNRTRMQGGGRKPYRQKGTGNARAGSNTSPLWYGGAVAHGPMPRSYEFKVPKKVRQQALVSVLSLRRKDGAFYILDELAVGSGKTRDMAELLDKLGLSGKRVALMLPNPAASNEVAKVWRSGRNLKKVTLMSVDGANVYDLMCAEVLVCTRDTALALQKRIGLEAPQA